jgi:peptidyl-prolyl cis-trans isomerase C
MRTIRALVVAVAAIGAAAAQQASPAHAPDAPRRPGVHDVARVNGVAITDDRLTIAVNALIPLESFHRNVSADKMAALQQKALDGLIDEELRHQDAVRQGITITTAQVDERLAELTRQYGGTRQLDEAERRNGVTMPQLKREIRRALTIQEAFARTVTATCQVGREEAAQFFRDNPDRFVRPEQVHIYAITIGVDPSSTAAKWAEAKARAEDVLGRIRRGASFEKMAQTYSTDPSNTKGGDMGYFHRGTLNDDFEKAASRLKIGQASDVIQTLYGYHIVRVADVRPSERKTFTDVSAELQKDLTARRCTEVENAWAARLRAHANVELVGASPQRPPVPRGSRP